MKAKHPKPILPAKVAPAPVIDQTAVYSVDQAQALLGLRTHSLRREIRSGRLRCSKRCGRHYLLGKWLLEWLEGGELRRYRGREEVNGRRAG